MGFLRYNSPMKSLRFESLHQRFIEQHTPSPNDISDKAHDAEPHSFGVHLVALSLTKMGDALLDIKLVLPWLLTAVGAPGFFVALLVPLRESLAMLPQFFIAAWAERVAIRKSLWSMGCVGQGLCVVGMAATPWLFSGSRAGWVLVLFLTLFSLSRCLCSIIIKDVQGKTIDKQHRGRVSGIATSFSGVVAILVAVCLLVGWLSSNSITALSILLALAAICWLVAALVYLCLKEQPSPTRKQSPPFTDRFKQYASLLNQKPVQCFLIVRGLLISTALVAPFYVVLANRHSEGNISALGLLLLLAGIANFLSGWFWGKLSDLSSRRVLSLTGVMAFLLAVIAYVGIDQQWEVSKNHLWYGLILFVLYITHAGVRLGRSTYLMDMANEHNRTQLVALSNTLIGVFLLVVGGITASLGNHSAEQIILGLGVCSLMGALLALRLPEVQRQPSTG